MDLSVLSIVLSGIVLAYETIRLVAHLLNKRNNKSGKRNQPKGNSLRTRRVMWFILGVITGEIIWLALKAALVV